MAPSRDKDMKIIDSKELQLVNGKYHLYRKGPYGAVYGFGEKFDEPNHAGLFVRSMVKEDCFYQGEFSYLSMPFFFSTEGFGFYIDTYVEVDFDFRDPSLIDISFAPGSKGEVAKIYYFEGQPKDILKEFRTLLGMPRMFPRWALGAWMSSNRWQSEAELREQMALAKKYDIPHNVMVCEPWSDATTHYLWMGSKQPLKPGDEGPSAEELDFSESKVWVDPKKLISDLHNEGLHLLLWLVPIYAEGTEVQSTWNEEQRVSDNQYAIEHKLCVMKPNGEPYRIPHTWCIESEIPDFTNPKTNEIWFKHWQYLLDMGVDGFKTDGGEFVHEEDAQFFDGTTGREGQQRYSDLYNEKFSQFVGPDRLIFSRAGGPRTPSYAVVWAGDQESTWSEFRSITKAGLSAGLSGISTWGFDIAGFSGYLPTRELYLRSVMMAAFAPIMQWHSDPVRNGRCDFSGAWKINDRSPWNMCAYLKDPALMEILRDQFNLHYNLIPYQYQLMKESHLTGIPAIRHLVLEYPEDKKGYDVADEFMLGSSLLIAPIYEDYISTRKLYLPNDTWFDLYSGKKFVGGYHEVEIASTHSPVFLRNNSIVPLNLKGNKLASPVGNDLEHYQTLTFLVSGEGTYCFNDDLGNEIVLEWNRDGHKTMKNVSGIEFRVLHVEKDRLF